MNTENFVTEDEVGVDNETAVSTTPFEDLLIPTDDSGTDINDMINTLDDAEPTVEGDETFKEPKPEEKKKASVYLITEEMQEEERQNIASLNVLALAQYKKSLKEQISSMESTKEMVEALENMMSDDQIGEKSFGHEIALQNIMRDLSVEQEEEIQEFKENYEANMAKLNKTMEWVEEREEELKDVKRSSSYMNQCMLEILDKKIDALSNQTSKKYKKVKIYYNNIHEVYSNRDSMDFLKSQVEPSIQYIQRVVSDLKKLSRNGGNDRNLIKSLQKNVSETFGVVFKIDQLIVFEKHLKEIFEGKFKDVDFTSFLFQYLLCVIYKNEKERRKGFHKWVEALILNIYDNASGNYDLDKPIEELDKEIISCASAMMNKIKM